MRAASQHSLVVSEGELSSLEDVEDDEDDEEDDEEEVGGPATARTRGWMMDVPAPLIMIVMIIMIMIVMIIMICSDDRDHDNVPEHATEGGDHHVVRVQPGRLLHTHHDLLHPGAVSINSCKLKINLSTYQPP